MFSDLIELLGLSCLVAGVFVLLGIGAAFLAAGACLIFIGQGIDDKGVSTALARSRARTGAALHRRRAQAAHALAAPVRKVRSRRAPKAV